MYRAREGPHNSQMVTRILCVLWVFLVMHTLGSGDIFSSVGIWVFDVKTRIYYRGAKNLNRTPKKGCRHGEKCVIFVKFQE